MCSPKGLLVGLISVVFFSGAGVLLIPTESQAAPKDKNLNKHCKEIVPWRGVIPGDQRFVETFIDDDGVAHAYCDRQTGLVWEAEPEFDPDGKDLVAATAHCLNRTVSWNGQKGGRLPSISELTSLVDTTSILCTGGGACLPDDNPFTTVTSTAYWSATSAGIDPDGTAWFVFLPSGAAGLGGKGNDNQAWCVRGSMNADVY